MDFLSEIILAKVSIEDVVKRYSSEDVHGLISCLYADHDDSTPSMKIYNQTNTVFCFGCNKGANVITLVSKAENCTPKQAMFKIKEWFGIDEQFHSVELKLENSKLDHSEFDKTYMIYLKKFQQAGIIITKEDLDLIEQLRNLNDFDGLLKLKTKILFYNEEH